MLHGFTIVFLYKDSHLGGSSRCFLCTGIRMLSCFTFGFMHMDSTVDHAPLLQSLYKSIRLCTLLHDGDYAQGRVCWPGVMGTRGVWQQFALFWQQPNPRHDHHGHADLLTPLLVASSSSSLRDAGWGRLHARFAPNLVSMGRENDDSSWEGTELPSETC